MSGYECVWIDKKWDALCAGIVLLSNSVYSTQDRPFSQVCDRQDLYSQMSQLVLKRLTLLKSELCVGATESYFVTVCGNSLLQVLNIVLHMYMTDRPIYMQNFVQRKSS